jgi:hypothetical protein
MEFETYPVRARKDLLHFVEERLDKNVLEKLGKEPKRWIEELNIIHGMLTGDCLVAGVGMYEPPIGDPAFKQLGDNVFLYRGKDSRLCGLYVGKEKERFDYKKKEIARGIEWTLNRIGGVARLALNKEFENLDSKLFLPESFEKNSRSIKAKRPIYYFEIKDLGVYAKGCDIAVFQAYEPPSFRLTNLSRVVKTNSKTEMRRFIELSEFGVNVPRIIGYYEADIEEFLFVEKVRGEEPSKFLESHRKQIIEQDAQMLAALCMLGYRKCGFCDADDKIFDSRNLYLIDVDELRDLYLPNKFDFRKMLMNPAELSELNEFRALQKSVFRKMLKDALYNYRNSLTPSFEHMKMYIYNFYSKAGWPKPDNDEIRALTEFPDNYQTMNSYISMMMED